MPDERRRPIALSIAGSDPSGGAGIQADLKVFHRYGVHGAAVVALLTAQDSAAVHRIAAIDPGFVAAELDAVLEGFRPDAVKTGALGSAAVVEVVASRLALLDAPIVVDPVIASTSGARLLDPDGVLALRERLLPIAELITPNLEEAGILAGFEVRDEAAIEAAAAAIHRLGARGVLITGLFGRLRGSREGEGAPAGEPIRVLDPEGSGGEVVLDLFSIESAAERPRGIEGPGKMTSQRLPGPAPHGTGCALSAAIAAERALGHGLYESVRHARAFVWEGIRRRQGIGPGPGAVDLFADPSSIRDALGERKS